MVFSLRRCIAVAKKEFLELNRNRLFFLMTILAPIVLFFLFAFAFSLDARNIPTGFVDLDKSAMSRNLIDSFTTATGIFDVKKVGSHYPELMEDMAQNRVRVVVVIPADFSRKLKKGMPVTLQVMVDGVIPSYANVVGSYINALLADYQSEILGEYFMRNGYVSASYVPVDMSVSAWYNAAFRSEDFIIPGVVGIIIMFFPPMVAAISLAKEKETGSILNMYCSSVTKVEYLTGKMLPYIVISYINCLLFVVFSVFLFHVPMRGNPLYIAIASLFFVASALGIGLLVAVLVSTQVAAIIISSIVTLTPSFIYSGFMVPVSNLGSNAKYYSYSLPTTFFIDLMRKVMVKGATFVNLRDDIAMLICITIIIYAACFLLFKKRLG